MIYIFIVLTIIVASTWLSKLFHFRKTENEPSDSEKVTLRSLPATILILVGVVYYFWTSGVNAMHLLYIYPTIAYLSFFIFGYIFQPRVRREFDQYLEKLLEVVDTKPSTSELRDLLQGYEFLGSHKIPAEFKSHIDEDSNEFIVEDEKDVVTACALYICKPVKNSLEKFFSNDIDAMHFKGEFRNDPLLVTVYYQKNNPVALGFTYFPDAKSFQGNAMGIHLTTMQLVLGDYISKRFGKHNEEGTTFHWGKENASAVLGLSPGPSITLFVFDRSAVI